jgi:hypothetical protein
MADMEISNDDTGDNDSGYWIADKELVTTIQIIMIADT